LIEIEVNEASKVKVEIFDSYGRSIIKLDKYYSSAGTYQVPIGKELPLSGVFICRVIVGNKVATLKMISSIGR
jgi:hypothetical protein